MNADATMASVAMVMQVSVASTLMNVVSLQPIQIITHATTMPTVSTFPATTTAPATMASSDPVESLQQLTLAATISTNATTAMPVATLTLNVSTVVEPIVVPAMKATMVRVTFVTTTTNVLWEHTTVRDYSASAKTSTPTLPTMATSKVTDATVAMVS